MNFEAATKVTTQAGDGEQGIKLQWPNAHEFPKEFKINVSVII